MILNKIVAAIADAIREKTGKSELIKPVDFAEEIKGITSGGGESSKRYYRIEMKDVTNALVQYYGTNMKADMGDGEIAVVGIGLIFAYGIPSANWKAVAIDIDTPTYSPTGSGIISFREQIEMEGGNVDDLADTGLISVTEAEFYDLNA